MSAKAQLEYESRVRFRQSAIAAVAGMMLVAAAIIQLGGVHTKVEELTLDLITEHKRFPVDLIGACVNSIGLVAVAITLNFVYTISKARNPEIKTFIRWLAVVGGGLSAITAIVYAVVIASKANDFVGHGAETYQQANALTSSGLVVALPLIAQFASLLLTGGFVWIALNAMRVGLLTRFMGYLGIFAGVLVLFPIGSPVPVVQGFWLLALSYLFTGRWPSGMPRAWATGQLERWPTNAEMRERRDAARGGGGREKVQRPVKPARTAVAVADDDSSAAGTPSRTRSDTPKRKRKRRR
ncbi:MAG TPA: hypothetical protein VG223_13485 [Solirubrobacteraceae bacterium]|jgi:hypothetical protein|nr:hypothetical protein [Solirubrobacteraceae bacterium]